MDQRSATLLRTGAAAAQAGLKREARSAFQEVLDLDPHSVAALLWLAWLSDDPLASQGYVERALAVDPDNDRALAARDWARSRLDSPVPKGRPSREPRHLGAQRRWRRFRPLIALGCLAAFVAGTLLAILWHAYQLPLWPAAATVTPGPGPIATVSPSPTAISTGAPTVVSPPVSTDIPAATPTETSSPTPVGALPPATTEAGTNTQEPIPTPTSTAYPTATPRPTATPLPTDLPPRPTPEEFPPTRPSRGAGHRWIDVDLSRQRVTAYEGQTPVHTSLASTGLPNTPTPVGEYRIYVKYLQDDMSGPGYYLPEVPYTMYFYRGYGIHGTYWHENFGHPMSHGCINLPTEEAEWFFSWASVGTLVNIHW